MSIEDVLKSIIENATHQGGTTYAIDEKYIAAAKEALSTAPRHASGKSEQIDTQYYCQKFSYNINPVKCSEQCKTCRRACPPDGIEPEPEFCECGHPDCQHEEKSPTDWTPAACKVEGCECKEFTEKAAEGPNQFNLLQHENLH